MQRTPTRLESILSHVPMPTPCRLLGLLLLVLLAGMLAGGK
jgi:hypothetical protein